jgi:chromosome partitioning protein
MIIAIAIQKGGSGKTTTAINLAAYLRKQGKKVLLIDLDPQANLTQSAGLLDEPEPNLYQVFKRLAAGQEVPPDYSLYRLKEIDIIPASLDLASTELELVSVYGREQLLKQFLAPLKTEYNYIIIDCPPAVGMLTVNGLVASDMVLIPLQAEFLPLKGLQNFMRSFELIRKQLNPKLKVAGYLLTRFDSRKNMHKQVANQIHNLYAGKVFGTRIRSNIALAQAQEKGMDIFRFSKNSNGARDYTNFGSEFLNRLGTG